MKVTKKVSKPKPKAAVISEDELRAARAKLTQLKVKQDALREQELEIRTYLADLLHDGDEGSKTVKVGDVKLTITRNINRSIGAAEAEKLSKEYSDVALECLRWRAEVKVGAYKENREVMDEYIVTKAGPPSVEFKD